MNQWQDACRKIAIDLLPIKALNIPPESTHSNENIYWT